MLKNIAKVFICIGVPLFLIPMLIPFVYSLFVWIVGIIFIVAALILFFVESSVEKHNTKVKRRNEIKSKFQQAYSEISMGADFNSVNNKLAKCKETIPAHLASEVVLENGIHRKVFVWHLDWEYVVSKSSGVGVMPIHTSTLNTSGNGMSFSNGTATSFSSGQTTRKAFIQMVFENDKLVAKEQQGLYE